MSEKKVCVLHECLLLGKALICMVCNEQVGNVMTEEDFD